MTTIRRLVTTLIGISFASCYLTPAAFANRPEPMSGPVRPAQCQSNPRRN